MFSVHYDEDYRKSQVVGCIPRNVDEYNQRALSIGLNPNVSIRNISLFSILRNCTILNRYRNKAPLIEAWKPRF